MELNQTEYEAFLKLSNSLSSDQPTKKLCLQYYLEYKAVLCEQSKLQTLSQDKVQVAMRCAFFLSEKSQVMYNVRGEKIRGVSLSLTQTLKSHNNLDEFVFFLKDIIRKIHLEDGELEAEINQFIKRFCFILTFYNKFESVFKKLDFQQLQQKAEGHRDYLRTLMSFGWLIFIDSKARVFKNSFEIIDVTCLMVSVFRFLINLSGDYARSQLFGDLERAKNPRDYKDLACQQLLEQFKIRDLKMFEHINSHFENYVNNTLLNDFRYNTGNDILSPIHISTNYKKLDATYQKTLSDPQDIDERYFLKERVSITPSRFTPFGGRGTATKWKKQNFNSQRILNYQLDDTVKQNAPAATPSTPSAPASTLKFPKNFTPTLTKPPVIFSTPMTQAMEMYNWIAEKPKRQRNSPLFDKTVDKIMALEKKGSDPKSKDNRKKLMQSLYEDCLAAYPLGDEDPGLLCWVVEAVYYILNLPGVPMGKMVEFADVEWYHLWRVTDYFLKYDKNMPNSLKMHILDIETRIVSMELWRQQTDLINIFSPGQGCKLTKRYPQADRFTRRVLHQLAYQIHLLTTPLNLSQALANTILTTVQHILCNHPSLLVQHHLDQLVLCSAYSLSKVVGLNLKFNEIILKYREANGYTKEIYNEIIEQVQTDGRKEDIIAFYNQNFIPTMKSYMIEIKGQKGMPTAPLSNKPSSLNLLGSPIKSLIPKQLLNIKMNSHMTPQTQMLYAYNQSPLLRGDHLHTMDARSPTGNFLPSKKLLNFQAELEQTSRKKPFEKPDGFADIQDATNDFINKKFNAKKKENIIQNGERPEGTLIKQGSGYFKVDDKLMRLKSKDKL